MNPASIGSDTLVALAVSVVTNVFVAVMVWFVQRKLAEAESERKQRDEHAAKERTKQAALQKAEHDCLASMARAKLVTMASDYNRIGFFPFEARRTFDALYETYEAMGEDGLIAETVDRARALPMHQQVQPRERQGNAR
jgi:hypothetical protein